ncbi:MAG TPA: adenylate/guanylate cyclase domain-containing protein [Anaerolineae bacterium]|nr:adenylate/guanylate cyclase domain-containing protein [Anaerolineae bacterium]
MDRRQALNHGQPIPAQAVGTALFADISGFTPLTDSLVQQLGPQRGTEELIHHLNKLYDTLITRIHDYRGSVISFVGDAIICWFEGDNGHRSIMAAIAMQNDMQQFAQTEIREGIIASLAIKIGIAHGQASRFLVGDPAIQQLEALAGTTMTNMALAESVARQGEIVITNDLAQRLEQDIKVSRWHQHPRSKQWFAIIEGARQLVQPDPWPPLALEKLSMEMLQTAVLPDVLTRLATSFGFFQAELRPTVALFLKFNDLDYDNDPQAGAKLDQFVRQVQHTVTGYGGHLLQLTIGDKGSSLYISFGILKTHMDNAARAVLTALDLRQIPQQLPFITDIQIGLAGGMTRTGLSGGNRRCCFVAMGDDVVLAARLMTLAPKGEIRCAYNVYRHTHQQIKYENLATVRLKGKVPKVYVYRPLGRGTTPVIDVYTTLPQSRQVEHADLEEKLQDIHKGKSRVLIIEGGPGLGKTWMVNQLLHLMEGRGTVGLQAKGTADSQEIPYSVWRSIFITYLGLDQLTGDIPWQAQIGTLANLLPSEQADLLPLLNDILPIEIPENSLTLELNDKQRQSHLHLLLLALLHFWSQQEPLPVILEGGEWWDTHSWQLTQEIAQSLMTIAAPILLTIITKPLSIDTLPGRTLTTIQQLPIAHTLKLAPMRDDEMVYLLADWLDIAVNTVPHKLTTQIQAVAKGNPGQAYRALAEMRQAGQVKVINGRCWLQNS